MYNNYNILPVVSTFSNARSVLYLCRAGSFEKDSKRFNTYCGMLSELVGAVSRLERGKEIVAVKLMKNIQEVNRKDIFSRYSS